MYLSWPSSLGLRRNSGWEGERKLVEIKVWGPYALFTRPESKVERVTYDVMTPSAARGVLEGILWRPAFSWQVRQIVVLQPVKRLSMLRNEVNSVASVRSARAWQASGGGFYAEEDRAQRHSLFLKDVSYIIRADIVLKPHADDPVAKYVEMFNRRVRKGQCHNQPYLGTRECSAFFEPPDGTEVPIDLNTDLGRMLFDLEIRPAKKGRLKYVSHDENGVGRVVSGTATPRFFNGALRGGVLTVPPELYLGSG